MTTINIQVNEPRASTFDTQAIRRAAVSALETAHAGENVELTIMISREEVLKDLNRDYRGKDRTTDVLAFPDGSLNPENGQVYLGDVIIAYPVAASQAEEAGHPIADEIQLLVIHGILHLVGFDHDSDENRNRMWEIQKRALMEINNQISTEDWV